MFSRHQNTFTQEVEEHGKLLEDQITRSVYENIPVRDLMEWATEVKEVEEHGPLPGSVEQCEEELDKHEVGHVIR